VGNLSFGGTGKTPHVLWLLDNLREHHIAVLSRGHGRTTTGFRKVEQQDSAETAGDEPILMYRRKGFRIPFFVCEDRINGINKLLEIVPETDLIILDDAFQHRKVNGRLNILLTTWENPYSDDNLVPSGTLRDVKSRARAAEVIIVTKCPPEESPSEDSWRKRLTLAPGQHLFFSCYKYGIPKEIMPTGSASDCAIPITANVVVITGIANGKDYHMKVQEKFPRSIHVAFPDHHTFKWKELQRALSKFRNFADGLNWILTTEKDAVRLEPFRAKIAELGIRMAFIPIDVEIINRKDELTKLLAEHVG
jgi:tetraacyldisaccharide 4'-kinase